MEVFKKLLNFYIQSSMHVAFAATAFMSVTFLSYGAKVDVLSAFFVFFGTISAYNFVKYAKIAGLHHRSLTEWLKAIQVFSFMCFVVLVYLLFKLPKEAFLLIGLLGMFVLFYAVPIVIFKNLRSLSGIKIFVVAIVWAGVTVVFPIVVLNLQFDTDVYLIIAQRFLYVIALMIPFEIRDLKYDDSTLKTIPQLFGIKKTKIIGLILLFIVLALEGFKDETNVYQIGLHLFFTGLLGLFLIRTKENQSKYYASFFVEGIPVLWFFTLYFLNST